MFSKYTMIRIVNLKCSTRTQLQFWPAVWLQRGFFQVQAIQAMTMGSWNVFRRIVDFKAKHILCTILQSSNSFTLCGNHIRRGMLISSQIDLVQPRVLKSFKKNYFLYNSYIFIVCDVQTCTVFSKYIYMHKCFSNAERKSTPNNFPFLHEKHTSNRCNNLR